MIAGTSTSTVVPLRYTRWVMNAEMGYVVSALLRPPYVCAWCPSLSVRVMVLVITSLSPGVLAYSTPGCWLTECSRRQYIHQSPCRWRS